MEHGRTPGPSVQLQGSVVVTVDRRAFLKLAALAGVGLAVPPSFVVVSQPYAFPVDFAAVYSEPLEPTEIATVGRALPTDATLAQIDAWLAANSVKPNIMLFLSEDAYRLLRNYYDEQVIGAILA